MSTYKCNTIAQTTHNQWETILSIILSQPKQLGISKDTVQQHKKAVWPRVRTSVKISCRLVEVRAEQSIVLQWVQEIHFTRIIKKILQLCIGIVPPGVGPWDQRVPLSDEAFHWLTVNMPKFKFKMSNQNNLSRYIRAHQ